MAILHITKENFEKEVLQSKEPVVVDFWAAWCGPCKALAPILEEVDAELAGTVKVAKINIDEEEELAAQFRVMSIPTLLLFKDGEVVNKTVGLAPKEDASCPASSDSKALHPSCYKSARWKDVTTQQDHTGPHSSHPPTKTG